MKKIIKLTSLLIWKIGSLLHHVSKYLYTPIQEKRMKPWLKINGDKTLRLDYDLNSKSIVIDAGGYEGQWASDIFSKYLCTIYIYEPVSNFYKQIQSRFKNNDKIKCINNGLSDSNYETNITLDNNSSSQFKIGDNNVEKIEMIDIVDFFTKNNISKVDLIKINIEGGEYNLLERIIEKNLVGRISNIQVQFHDFVPESKKRMKYIQDKLSITHNITYQYEFVWENWKLKDQNAN